MLAGIIRYGSYVPYWRIQRSVMGGGKGERAVASYDEDSASMAVEAARDALRDGPDVQGVIFATLSPPYAEKLNATTIQAACGLSEEIRSIDLTGSSRLGLSGLLLAADISKAGQRTLVCAGDVSVGAPGSPRESDGGDGAAAFIIGNDDESIARIIGRASITTEFLDIYRIPEDRFVHQWEERFGADTLAPMYIEAAKRALKDAGVTAADLSAVILDAANMRAVSTMPKALGIKPEQAANSLAAQVGRTGTAHSLLLLASVLDKSKPGDRILVLTGGDGCDVVVLEVTDKIVANRPRHSVEGWIASKRTDMDYLKYLKWRGIMPFEPPRRPEPPRPAAPPSRRTEAWKFHFQGSRCEKCGTGHLPPQKVCSHCGAVDQMAPQQYADDTCKIATYTLDYLIYSLQQPMVIGVVDFGQGGRLRSELTDVDPKDVKIGNELEMTFRRLYTSQGVHNYFWKARPKR